jgi:peptide methionine sulfoxide reductase MsrB
MTGDVHDCAALETKSGKEGLRYCVNSAPLRVIHRDQLGCERFGEYVRFFAKQEA